jgi:hypothetical protein
VINQVNQSGRKLLCNWAERSRVGSRDDAREIGTEERSRLLMIDARKERHGSVEVADPDLGGARIEVEGAFLLDLGWGVRRGKDFDADLRRASEYERSRDQLGTATAEPGEVHRLNPVGCRNGAFGEWSSLRKELQQKSKHLALAVGVHEARRGCHKDMSMPISLDPVGKLREILVGQDLGPSSQVEPGLRSEIRKLNGDRHATKIHQKRKKRDKDRE